MSEASIPFDQVDELARWLFTLADSDGVWRAEDEATRLHWRKEAQRRLQSLRLSTESAT